MVEANNTVLDHLNYSRGNEDIMNTKKKPTIAENFTEATKTENLHHVHFIAIPRNHRWVLSALGQ